MGEVDLLRNYPRSHRNLEDRVKRKSEQSRAIARQFGREFFDGDREFGYGGFSYHPRFWSPVVPDIIEHYGICDGESVLDVGCAKGFMIYDMAQALPSSTFAGVDISEYAIANAMPEVAPLLRVGDCRQLPFEDKSFDYVFSINTIHNCDLDGVVQSLREITRVSKKGSFITVDAYRNDHEKARMMAWNLTARSIFSVSEWPVIFEEAGYKGDFYWFIP